jgi:hypothetical protein
MAGKVIVEFRYVDRDSCSRCKKTGKNVEKSCLKLKGKLKTLGTTVIFRARKLPLSSSGNPIPSGLTGRI